MSATGLPPIPGDGDAVPRRLHPASMVIDLIRGAPSTLLGVPALLALAARLNGWIVLAGTLAAVAVAGLSRWLAWSRFTYALDTDAMVIESGVLGRNRRTIPYERVADVNIERRPLQRLFGLATVTLETGGAGADEGALNSVSVAEATRLRDVIRRRRGGVEPAVADAPALPVPAADPIFAMDTRRVLLWGLFNFSLVWIAVGLGAVQYVSNALDLDNALWNAVIARTGEARTLPPTVWARAIAVGGAIALLLGVVAGLIRTTLREHGYRLTDEGGRLRRVRGLFTRSEVVVSLPRIQLAAIDSGLVRRRLGWARLRAQVLGGEGSGGRQDLAPLAEAAEVDRLLATLRLRRADPSDLALVARGHVWRALLRKAGLPALLIAGAAVASPLALLALPLLLPMTIAALLDRRYHRYRLAGQLLQVQRGVFRRTTWIVPAARIQAVTLRRSWLQRRLGLASVHVDTAGRGAHAGPDVHDLRDEDAEALAAALRAAMIGKTG